ncbi:hypothetical protein, partial [Aneurinibacillus sp. REN35]|uniref:hypothetical protein n=1 Tax=Aneurinibacillus sp. REN35 TaxID=3237286 RepID=UPI003528D7EC
AGHARRRAERNGDPAARSAAEGNSGQRLVGAGARSRRDGAGFVRQARGRHRAVYGGGAGDAIGVPGPLRLDRLVPVRRG